MRRTVGDRPPVLLLGAGASIDAGIGAMPELYRFFNCKDFDSFVAYIDTVSIAERYRYLAEFLQTRTPDAVTPGYQALATLCAENYFDLVLTTNMDPLLDDALAAARLWRRDYLLLVNGIIRPDRLKLLLQGQSPRVKIIKLHGDLFQRYMAWTIGEMDTFLGEIAPQLTVAVDGRDFLVVGYSLRDARVRQLVESANGAVWFTHPNAAPEHLQPKGGVALPGLRTVVAPDCAFEKFFPALLQSLRPAAVTDQDAPATGKRGRSGAAAGKPARQELPAKQALPAAASTQARTTDDLMAAVFAVAGANGSASSTAFLLADPRVIVCDAFSGLREVRKKSLELIAANGHRYRARVLGNDAAHPFGPLILQAPKELKVPGLALDRSKPALGGRVRVAVSAGEIPGLSDGTIGAASRPLRIEPIAKPVAQLVELECFVAPGSSGAPVVNESMAVSGFIVAGSSDPDHPRSFMYPTSAWAAFLDELG